MLRYKAFLTVLVNIYITLLFTEVEVASGGLFTEPQSSDCLTDWLTGWQNDWLKTWQNYWLIEHCT